MKKRWLGVLAVCCALLASVARATPMTYDLAVRNNWVTVGAPSFGLEGDPVLKGWVTVDNAYSGLDAFKEFSFTTGTHTWTLSEFVGPTARAWFDTKGSLVQFSLDAFESGGTRLYFYSLNTINVFSDSTNAFFCNACVSFVQSEAHPVAEPSTIGLVGFGLIGVGLLIRRTRKTLVRRSDRVKSREA